MDRDLLEIKITGAKEAAFETRDAVLKELDQIERAEKDRRQEQFINSKVQWEYQENGNKWVRFRWEDSWVREVYCACRVDDITTQCVFPTISFENIMPSLNVLTSHHYSRASACNTLHCSCGNQSIKCNYNLAI